MINDCLKPKEQNVISVRGILARLSARQVLDSLGRVHISVRTRLFGRFLPSSAPKILEVRKYICEFLT